MSQMEEFNSLCKSLEQNPIEELWSEFHTRLKDTNVRYYQVNYEKGKVDTEQDLLASVVALFDELGNKVASVPIYVKDRDKVKGALFYLRGLTRMTGGELK